MRQQHQQSFAVIVLRLVATCSVSFCPEELLSPSKAKGPVSVDMPVMFLPTSTVGTRAEEEEREQVICNNVSSSITLDKDRLGADSHPAASAWQSAVDEEQQRDGSSHYCCCIADAYTTTHTQHIRRVVPPSLDPLVQSKSCSLQLRHLIPGGAP